MNFIQGSWSIWIWFGSPLQGSHMWEWSVAAYPFNVLVKSFPKMSPYASGMFTTWISMTCCTLGSAVIYIGIQFISPTMLISFFSSWVTFLLEGMGVIPKDLHTTRGMTLASSLESSKQLCKFFPNIRMVVRKGGVSSFPWKRPIGVSIWATRALFLLPALSLAYVEGWSLGFFLLFWSNFFTGCLPVN